MSRKLMAGIVIVAIGIISGMASVQYKIGSLARMGSGYYPLIISILLTVIGAIVCFTSRGADDKLNVIDACIKVARPWIFIVSSVIIFILSAHWLGFVIASFLCVFVAAFADKNNTWKSSFLLAAATTMFAVIVFYYGVRIQIPLFIY